MPAAGPQMGEDSGSRARLLLAARTFTDTGSFCDCDRGFSAWRGGESKRRRRWGIRRARERSNILGRNECN